MHSPSDPTFHAHILATPGHFAPSISPATFVAIPAPPSPAGVPTPCALCPTGPACPFFGPASPAAH